MHSRDTVCVQARLTVTASTLQPPSTPVAAPAAPPLTQDSSKISIPTIRSCKQLPEQPTAHKRSTQSAASCTARSTARSAQQPRRSCCALVRCSLLKSGRMRAPVATWTLWTRFWAGVLRSGGCKPRSRRRSRQQTQSVLQMLSKAAQPLRLLQRALTGRTVCNGSCWVSWTSHCCAAHRLMVLHFCHLAAALALAVQQIHQQAAVP